ncbi:class I SAM-dependent methyltransferase [Halorussus caseinilyticus]|uniref:Class I SAM-dependent methyltransferase n=1 Tax=Halorussus caseinilyticus TaxID=3034025 RepID=A0ABD5WJP2_9EURY|nr:class I SAM-dependent methyltransferase [Halorussus sp. DT72]
MRIPTTEDFAELESWGLVEDPMAAIADYSDERAERRWDNDRHCRAHREHAENQSEEFLADAQAYYRSMDRPIDRRKWAFLKRRKAWFHPPVEWGRFAATDASRILDLGCGDGDVTQRVAEFVAGRWTQTGYDGAPMEIVGVDLNESRVRNARKLAESPHEKITLTFEQADATDRLDYGEDFFDYALLNGVFEVLDDENFEAVRDEVSRVTAIGLYVRDLLDDYEGLHPRPDLPDSLADRGFETVARHKIFEEPFAEEGTTDPLAVWPMNVHQVLFAEASDVSSLADRY